MSGNGQRLRASLIRSLRTKPLLVEAEEALHAFSGVSMSQRLRGSLIQSVGGEHTLSEAEGLVFGSYQRDEMNKFRTAIEGALKCEASVTDAEHDVLKSLGFQKLGEFRSRVRSGLGAPAEIPERDLAIYVSADEAKDPAYLQALRQQYAEFEVPLPVSEPDSADIASLTEMQLMDLISEEVLPSRDDVLPRWEPSIVSTPEKPELVETEKEPVGVSEPISDDEQVTSVIKITPEERLSVSEDMFDYRRLNPVPRLTAALEAAGIEQDEFGFILRYGRYAAEGRRSDFLVGGLGLAELSNRIAAWLKEQGPMNAQVQVVDEGSDELIIYLLSEEEA